jgi:D-arabinose 5-phosphate isomerase GutQ
MSSDDAVLAKLAGAVLSRESAALAALVGTVDSGVVTVARQMIDVAGKVVTTGSGTSGIMAERLAHLLSVCGTPSVYLPSMDALHGGIGAITTSDLVIAISKTGQSRELTILVERLSRRAVHVVAVTEAPASPFASVAGSVVVLPQPRTHGRDLTALRRRWAVLAESPVLDGGGTR